MTQSAAVKMTFLLIEEYASMPFIAAVEALRAANRILGFKAYHWQITSIDGKPVTASNGIQTAADFELSGNLDTDFIFVVASDVYEPTYRSKLNSCLGQIARRKVKIGGLSLGSWILARAGLLENAKCTIHWEALPAFKEKFPHIDAVNELFVVDRDRYTSSGGVDAMEMMIHLISKDHGASIGQKIANNFHLDRVRNASSQQRPGSVARMDTLPSSIRDAIDLMNANIEHPLSNSEIAASIKTSVRNLERMYMRKLKTSPAKYYLALRLEKARELLIHTNHSTLEIALQSGFSSSSYFARCFMREFSMRPSDVRKKQ